MLTVATMFITRQGTETVKFGHPKLIKLPNIVKLSVLLEVVEMLVRQSVSAVELQYKMRVVLVSDTGEERCDVTSIVDELGEIVLKPADNIAVIIEDIDNNMMELFNMTKQDSSMQSERVKPELDITDCLDSFSCREILDQSNPWFCPMCQKNQTATRTLSVWRYPDYLIIHLKRFVYNSTAGSIKLDKKVNFPLEGLDLTPYLSGPLQHGGELFDLYGSVCHYGSSSGEDLFVLFTFETLPELCTMFAVHNLQFSFDFEVLIITMTHHLCSKHLIHQTTYICCRGTLHCLCETLSIRDLEPVQ